MLTKVETDMTGENRGIKLRSNFWFCETVTQVGYLINEKKILMTTSNVFCLENNFGYIILVCE